MQTDAKYWVVVASRDHVKAGIAGGFTQACHGKASPLRRMRPGDYVVWYSGKERFGSPAPCQRFTAIGQISKDEVYQVEMAPDFCPYRRDVDFLESREASILPLINDLSFIRNKKSWGYPFRRGFFEINRQDFELIASQMLIHAHA